MTGEGVGTARVLRALLADVLTDAAMQLRHGPDAQAQALAVHVLALDGPHRSAWARLAASTCPPGQREAARAMVAELLVKTHIAGDANG